MPSYDLNGRKVIQYDLWEGAAGATGPPKPKPHQDSKSNNLQHKHQQEARREAGRVSAAGSAATTCPVLTPEASTEGPTLFNLSTHQLAGADEPPNAALVLQLVASQAGGSGSSVCDDDAASDLTEPLLLEPGEVYPAGSSWLEGGYCTTFNVLGLGSSCDRLSSSTGGDGNSLSLGLGSKAEPALPAGGGGDDNDHSGSGSTITTAAPGCHPLLLVPLPFASLRHYALPHTSQAATATRSAGAVRDSTQAAHSGSKAHAGVMRRTMKQWAVPAAAPASGGGQQGAGSSRERVQQLRAKWQAVKASWCIR